MSNSRSGMSQMNGNSNRRPPVLNRNNSNEKTSNSGTPHDYIIKYVCDTWNAVNQEMDKNLGNIKYYKEENHNMKDFQPFDLEAYWGRRVVQYYQNQNQSRHS